MNSQKQQKTPLNTKSDRFIIIIDPKEKEPLNAQIEYLKATMTVLTNYTTVFKFVATIIHDKDVTENGTPKTPHLHAFIETFEERTLKEWLTELIELTGATKQQIQIDITNSEILQVQYLRHDRKTEKANYDKSLILTNNTEELERRLNADYKKPIDPIEEAVKNCKSLMDLIEAVGISQANKYRSLFKDLHANDYQMLKNDYDKLKSKYENLYILTTELLSAIREAKSKNQNSRLIKSEYFEERFENLDY